MLSVKGRKQPSSSSNNTQEALPFLFGIEIETLIGIPGGRIEVPERNEYAAAVGRVVAHLKSHGLNAVEDHYNKSGDYTTWKVAMDGSVDPGWTEILLEQSAPQCFGSGKPSTQEWTLQNIELISPPLPVISLAAPPESQSDWSSVAGKYFEAMTSNNRDSEPSFVAYLSVECGFHIHFGFQNNAIPPLGFLQHLATLVLIYEPVFSSLHAPHRTAGPIIGEFAIEYTNSNRIHFRRDAHSCKDHELTAAYFKERILACQSVDELAWQMCAAEAPSETVQQERSKPCKERIVSFDLLHSTSVRACKTVEFRQPAGILSGREAAFTVQLYTALMRAAERRWRFEALQGPKTRAMRQSQDPEDKDLPTLDDLLGVLRLCPEAESFWRARHHAMGRERIAAEQKAGVKVGSCVACADGEDQDDDQDEDQDGNDEESGDENWDEHEDEDRNEHEDGDRYADEMEIEHRGLRS